MGTEKGGIYHGAAADLSLYGSTNVDKVQYTSSIVRISNSKEGNTMSFIQAGWTVNPFINGDTSTRLFGSWSPLYSELGGCYNLLCPGFVQIDSRVPLGMKLQPLSVAHGMQHWIPIVLFRELETGHWWLSVGRNGNESATVGYWPSSLFSKGIEMETTNLIQFGGLVQSPMYLEKSVPPMGSGNFLDVGDLTAAAVGNVEYVNAQQQFIHLDRIDVRELQLCMLLKNIDVMDYSLVGIDEEKHELVMGIIGFMRQYTWGKHLETWVKASGILGGPKNTEKV